MSWGGFGWGHERLAEEEKRQKEEQRRQIEAERRRQEEERRRVEQQRRMELQKQQVNSITSASDQSIEKMSSLIDESFR